MRGGARDEIDERVLIDAVLERREELVAWRAS
jgi:hypothetical protein